MLVPDVVTGIAELLAVLTEPDDGIVVNPPVYGPFFMTVAAAGRRIVEAPLALGDDGVWRLDLDVLERAFADGAASTCSATRTTRRASSTRARSWPRSPSSRRATA